MQELVEPTLFRELLRQAGRGAQREAADALEMSAALVSRMASGKSDISVERFQALAPKLALGLKEPDERLQPLWIVTRLHASGGIGSPPATRDGQLVYFANYHEAAWAASYLRMFPFAATAVAVPVRRAYLRQVLRDEHGRDLEALEPFSLVTDDPQGDVERAQEVLDALRNGFIVQRDPTGTAGYS